jgi:hypothetical protein
VYVNRPKSGQTGNDFDEIAPSHRLPQGLGPRQSHQRLQQGFATGEMGSVMKVTVMWLKALI